MGDSNILYHKSKDCIIASNFVEDLPMNLSDMESRALVISALEKLKQSLKAVDVITDVDIQTIRLYCSKIIDLVNYLEKQNQEKFQKLIRYLKECLNILEQYITDYYHKVGELPDYSRYEKEYYNRYFNYYEYYPSSYYYWNKYVSKEKPLFKYVDKYTGKLELTEEAKDAIFREISTPDTRKYLWDRPECTFEELMAYTLEKLQQKTEELRSKRLELEAKKQQELSQDSLHEKMEFILNVWLPWEKKRMEEQ
ncbi:hypothetical protein [Saccharolobus sp.]|uniref:hypothetical protein n=1 Tax=Saccharolobus sp. TaxID=2100761 RepID=UPI0031787F1B